ncbi:MAG: hypothetical protein A2V70_03880 [Planctomycetes bacterium RBG_13_63_9]|nr:MAG: hypothetical protein A2V70_03880 [Planctomycetes bacterium RBG_13_63_9]
MTSHPNAPGDGKSQPRRYRALSGMAVTSLVFAVLSVLTPFHWVLGILPATGVALGGLALWRIHEAPSELTGRALALVGLWLSLGFWVAGYGWLTFRQVQEVPFGYEQISYEMLQPGSGEKIAAKAYELQGKKVFVRGYMSPGRQQARLKAFILCPAIPNCPFCNPKPKPTEMIEVTLEGDLRVDYTAHLVRLGGTFQVDPFSLRGVPYQMEVDYVR